MFSPVHPPLHPELPDLLPPFLEVRELREVVADGVAGQGVVPQIGKKIININLYFFIRLVKGVERGCSCLSGKSK